MSNLVNLLHKFHDQIYNGIIEHRKILILEGRFFKYLQKV